MSKTHAARPGTGNTTAASQRLAVAYRRTTAPPTIDTVSKLAPGNYRRICRGCGISPQHIARVVTGRKGASLHVANRIAVAAGVTLDELYAFIVNSPALKVRGRRTVADVREVAPEGIRRHTLRRRLSPRLTQPQVTVADDTAVADATTVETL
jgi:transcriptional regulator with XRE-family HTH domain